MHDVKIALVTICATITLFIAYVVWMGFRPVSADATPTVVTMPQLYYRNVENDWPRSREGDVIVWDLYSSLKLNPINEGV